MLSGLALGTGRVAVTAVDNTMGARLQNSFVTEHRNTTINTTAVRDDESKATLRRKDAEIQALKQLIQQLQLKLTSNE